MTSTSFNVGLGDGSRLSSRVLRPPGGGHTDIFGGEPEPPRGRRGAPSAIASITQGQVDEPAKPTNGAESPAQNGQASEPQEAPVTPPAPVSPIAPVTPTEAKTESPKAVTPTEPLKPDAPKRVRVPPGGFSSGLCNKSGTGNLDSKPMDSGGNTGRQSRLLGRLLGKLRGEHRYAALDKNFSFTSTGMSESVGCGSANEEEEEADAPQAGASSATMDDVNFGANIDLRYGGQYLTPEQLPEFCNQIHHLVEVIRNIQSYAKVTGEYPSELERCLEREAREVASLASEARNAREAASRARLQRRALRAHRAQLVANLAKLRDAEVRELESSVRASDRKLFKSWETLRDSTDPTAFEALLEEVRSKQAALECLVRLIESRRANISRLTTLQTFPPPALDDEDSIQIGNMRKRQDTRRSGKRKRKDANREPRSVPLSGETSQHNPQQVTLYIQGTECSRLGAGSVGTVTLRPLELPSASVRDILFFTTD